MLDRVYLLQERFDLFRFEASGIEAILEPFRRGEGVLAFGAHLGSFEALRMIGHEKGLRVAMIMYEDNARLINETLAALAPRAKLHTIELGRIDAMLSIRRWLDEGGVAGLLADRSLPVGNSQRSKAIALPFLGAPAYFPDGPFRLAAMLRRRVVFMAGLYRGGRDYDLRFVELADFSRLPGAGAAAAGERDAAVRAAMRALRGDARSACAAKRPTTGSTSTTSGPMPTTPTSASAAALSVGASSPRRSPHRASRRRSRSRRALRRRKRSTSAR